MFPQPEDPALRAWVDTALAPWITALNEGLAPETCWVSLTWKVAEGAAVLSQPVHRSHATDRGRPTTEVGASAHARLRVAQHHDAAIGGAAQLLARLLPHLNPNIRLGKLKISMPNGQVSLLVTCDAFGKRYSSCIPARDGRVAARIEDLVRELEYPGQYAIPH